MTLRIRADRRLIRPTYRSHRFVLAEIVAPASGRTTGRPPVNLAFVLDRSGSMGGEKLRLAKQAVEASIARLHDDDRFSVVVYDDRIDVVVPGTLATPEARRRAVESLQGIEARGSTALGEGWLRGCQQVADALASEGVNRCLLLTDGLANVGITDRDELARHAAELRARGVQTTTFGVGADFDEVLLQGMASAGGGHFYFLADAAAIRDYVTSEVGEALDVVARDVALEISAPDGVEVECLSRYGTREVRGRTDILLGDLTADEMASVVLRLRFPYGQLGRQTGIVAAVSDRDGMMARATDRLAWEYADDGANDAQDRDRAVDRAVARIYAAKARQEAVQRNRMGDFEGARHVLAATASRIRKYAGRDTELRAILADLEAELDRFDRPMPELLRKEAYAMANYASRSRDMLGRAMKVDPADRS